MWRVTIDLSYSLYLAVDCWPILFCLPGILSIWRITVDQSCLYLACDCGPIIASLSSRWLLTNHILSTRQLTVGQSYPLYVTGDHILSTKYIPNSRWLLINHILSTCQVTTDEAYSFHLTSDYWPNIFSLPSRWILTNHMLSNWRVKINHILSTWRVTIDWQVTVDKSYTLYLDGD